MADLHGFRRLFRAKPQNVTEPVTLGEPQKTALFLYIFINVMKYIYIQPPEKISVYIVYTGEGDIYRDMFFGNP
jgi:hypothetical protein